MKRLLISLLSIAICLSACQNGVKQASVGVDSTYLWPHRPQIHFSPTEKWMNDPNGMVYSNGVYHLFYQYYPDSTVWGPMHWGHATSKDLVHWEHQPIALYPDSLGYIFSGSAVVDEKNTSGFGQGGKAPLVAIFTHHDPVGEKKGRLDFQNQSIAYSLDDGKSWIKYTGNPVVKNPGIKDFRDPKVMWHEESQRWIMTLATMDRISFYSSPDLKNWKKESEFGQDLGAHGGVWECPDLFSLQHEGTTVWVLLVSINPGGPNGGSATQYFTGAFDGHRFIPYQTDTRWLDYGPDNYAGVTWSGTGSRKLLLGWMSNWQYAQVVPTVQWRSAMTIPRELGLHKKGEEYLVTSKPVNELEVLNEGKKRLSNLQGSVELPPSLGSFSYPCRIRLVIDSLQSFSLTFYNDQGEKQLVGYDQKNNLFYLDRTASGIVSFEPNFAKRSIAPRMANQKQSDVELLLDRSSIELFADSGTTVMTQIFFPRTPFSRVRLQGSEQLRIDSLIYTPLRSIFIKNGNDNQHDLE